VTGIRERELREKKKKNKLWGLRGKKNCGSLILGVNFAKLLEMTSFLLSK
jgi:hypothetical protein